MDIDLTIDSVEECKYCGEKNAFKLGFASDNITVFHQLIRLAIVLNEQRRTEETGSLKNTKSVDAWGYWYEFCTVTVDVGRRFGKTKFIEKYASEFDLVIVHNQMQLQRLTYQNSPAIVTMGTLFDLTRNSNHVYKRIWVDEPTACGLYNRERIARVYEYTGRHETEQTWIFLGK